MEALPGGEFRFFLPDGREVLPAPPVPEVTEDPVNLLVRQWLPPLVAITPSTGRPTWQGEKPDYEWMGWCLGSLASREEP